MTLNMGFSGAKVEIGTAVVKTSRDAKSARRLEKAALKQQWLVNHLPDDMHVPNIQSIRFDRDGRCVVTMDKVDGKRLEIWLADNVSNLDAQIEMGHRLGIITKDLSQLRMAPSTINETAFLCGKLRSVEAYLRSNYTASSQQVLFEFYSALGEFTAPKDILNPTFCHGDLAFDNILITDNGKLWFIDLLDQEYDNYYCDVAKVLQSTYIDWPAIRDGKIRDSLMLARSPRPGELAYKAFLSAFMLEMNVSMLHDSRVPLYLAVCLARIIPYAPTWRQQKALLQLVNYKLNEYLLQNRKG